MSLRLATWNVRALHRPGAPPWPDLPSMDQARVDAKLDFLEERIRAVRPQVLAVQEICDPESFEALRARLADLLPDGYLGPRGEGSGLRVGILVAGKIESATAIQEIPAAGRFGFEAGDPPLRTRFRRAVIQATVQVGAETLRVHAVHLKAKRPEMLAGEDPSRDPSATARAMGRSLAIRSAEAAGLRAVLDETLAAAGRGVVLMGDLNDGPEAVTTQILAEPPGPDAAAIDPRGKGFVNTHDLQRKRTPRRTAYTHVFEGRPEALDHVIVSNDLAARFRRVRVYNDFLEDADDEPTLTDHGLVLVELG